VIQAPSSFDHVKCHGVCALSFDLELDPLLCHKSCKNLAFISLKSKYIILALEITFSRNISEQKFLRRIQFIKIKIQHIRNYGLQKKRRWTLKVHL